MFFECSNLTSLDLSTFNISSVTDMDCMLDGCSKVKKVYIKDERIKSKLHNGVNPKTK